MENLNTDLFVKSFSFWEHLNDDEKANLCANTKSITYKKGTRIHNGGDDCLGLFLVTKGELRTFILSEDGREITLFRLNTGETCILSASCVLDEITFDVFIDAEEDTDVLLINTSVYKRLKDTNIYVENFSHKLTSAKFSEVMWTMEQILFMGADKRLAIFLLDEMSKTGSDKIQLTHEQIAKYMGSAREVISRMLKYFVSEGIVELSRGNILITDKNKLKKIAL